jgi:hypothetical protein
MTAPNETKKDPAPGKSKWLNVFIWVTMAVLVILTVVWIVWAEHQPAVQSMWGD